MDNERRYRAVANDGEDGDISGGITWTSDRDGPLGTGASTSVTRIRGTPCPLFPRTPQAQQRQALMLPRGDISALG